MKHFRFHLKGSIQIGFIVLFLGILILPSAGMLLPITPHVEFSENRQLAALPQTPGSWSQIPGFIRDFESYYKDHFGFRPTLIQSYNVYKAKLIHESPSDNAIVGKNDWLYLVEDDGLLRLKKTLSEKELEGLTKAIEARKDYFAKKGALYFFVVAPDKQTIYPEYLPSYPGHWLPAYHRYEQLFDYFPAHSTQDVLINVKPVMLREKARGKQVYLRTDSHWNDYAGWLAYCAIMEKIHQYKPEVVGKTEAEIQWLPQKHSGDISRFFLGDKDMFQEDTEVIALRSPQAWSFSVKYYDRNEQYDGAKLSYPLFTSESPSGVPLKLVVLGDSQSAHFITLFSQSFRKVFLFTHWEKMEAVTKIIETEKPDIVLQEVVERELRHGEYLFRLD